MNISDLNYFEAVSGEELTGGSIRGTNRSYTFNKNVNIRENVNVDVDIDGNLALVDGQADAFGFFGTATEVIGSTYTSPFNSSSKLIATSATD